MKRFTLSLALMAGLAILFGFPVFASAAVDCTNTGVTGVTQIECEALMALYNSTTGTGWTNKTNWNTASAVGTWYGVTVSGGHVTTLNLNTTFAGNNLAGTLPTELGNLTYLTGLNLGANTNNGLASSTIPASIGSLTNLTFLSLYSNNLIGPIPTEIGNLTKLATLFLHVNRLTGAIPASFSNLTKITNLYLGVNLLTGSVPSGLSSSTLKVLQLYNNNLSGPLPSGLSSVPLTDLRIQNNNFVFSDFETNFASYCSGSSTQFIYSPQNNVDSTRTLTFSAGDALSITPSVASNINDIYQWYKDGVIISGAISRIYTKTAQEIDGGVYSYRVTNSVVPNSTLQSNNITVNIIPNPPAIDNVYYIVGATDVWVRGAISEGKDIAQRYIMSATSNQNINFALTYVISSTTPNRVPQYQTGTSIGNGGDDSTPVYAYNAGYIMADHGLSAPVVTSNGHNKTSVDIGSRWSDGTYEYILAEISGSTLTFYSIPTGSPWAMRTGVSGTLSHVSGATHTGNITVTSQTSVQKYPVVKNVVRHILVNGITEATSSDSTYAGYANFVDLVEEFDLVDPSTLVTTNNPWVWNDGQVWMHVKNVFRATAGSTVVHSTYNILRPMNLNYMGVIQSGALTTTNYDHQYYYIPKTKPISGYDFKTKQIFDTAPASQLTFTSAYNESANSPPDRQIIYLKKDADSNYDLGFAFGYSPLSTSTRSCGTNINLGCWWIYTTKKTYPVYVGGVGNIDGITYDAYAYRQYVDFSQYGINKSAYWNNQDGHDYVYIDYHENVTDDVTVLPSSYTGKAIRIIESENISLTRANVPTSGVVLSTTGANTYGYAVLELFDDVTPPAIALTSPTNEETVSGRSVTLTVTASDDIALASIQIIVDGSNYGSTSATSPYSLTWDSTSVTDGTHAISAVACDTSNNCATSVSVSINVRNNGGAIISLPPSIGTGSNDLSIPMNGSGSLGTLTPTGTNLLAYINSVASFTTSVSNYATNQDHKLTITGLDLSKNTITLLIESTPQTITLNLNETSNIDLDQDSQPDISIKFANLYVNRAELTIKSLLASTNSTSTTVIIPNTQGRIIKVNAKNRPGVYYVINGFKYLFVNRGTYTSWSNALGDTGNRFSTLKTVTQAEFDTIPTGGNLIAKSGNLIKFDDSSIIYAIGSEGKLYRFADKATQTKLYGTSTPYTIQSSFRNDYFNHGNAVSVLSESSVKPE